MILVIYAWHKDSSRHWQDLNVLLRDSYIKLGYRRSHCSGAPGRPGFRVFRVYSLYQTGSLFKSAELVRYIGYLFFCLNNVANVTL